MSELNIKIRKLQDNGSTFRATPESLYMGGVGSAKVDTLYFDVPEEWKGCAITLHVQRLSGTLPDPQLLDEKNRAVVDQRWTKEKQGLWMLMAVGADGYTAMTKPGRYTCYETIDRDSTTETITPSVYEQFVALVKKETAEANRAAKNAAASAEIAKSFESTITATGEQVQREITATADQTKQAIDEKTKVALASIPEDYTALSESVGQVKEDLDGLVKINKNYISGTASQYAMNKNGTDSTLGYKKTFGVTLGDSVYISGYKYSNNTPLYIFMNNGEIVSYETGLNSGASYENIEIIVPESVDTVVINGQKADSISVYTKEIVPYMTEKECNDIFAKKVIHFDEISGKVSQYALNADNSNSEYGYKKIYSVESGKMIYISGRSEERR